MDNPSIALPCPRNEHPLYRREYRVATPSIEKFWEVVLDCLKKRIPGAMIYAKPRFGKTHAIHYESLSGRIQPFLVCFSTRQAVFKYAIVHGFFCR